MIVKHIVVLSCIIICFGLIGAVTFYMLSNNIYIKAHNECKTSSSNCKLHCMGSKLGFVNSTGSVNLKLTPLGDVIMDLNILDECEAINQNSTNKCERTNDILDCLGFSFLDIFAETSEKCANKTLLSGLPPSLNKDEILNSFKDQTKACYNLCIMRYFGVVDEVGNLRVKQLFKNIILFEESDLESSVHECAMEHLLADYCNRASKRAVCTIEKLVEKVGLPQLIRMKYTFQ